MIDDGHDRQDVMVDPATNDKLRKDDDENNGFQSGDPNEFKIATVCETNKQRLLRSWSDLYARARSSEESWSLLKCHTETI